MKRVVIDFIRPTIFFTRLVDCVGSSEGRIVPLRSRSVCGAGLAFVIAFLFCAACSDSSAPVPKPTPTLVVNVAQTSINTAWGDSRTVSVSVSRGTGYVGTLAMTAAGAPAGVTLIFSPATIPAGDTSTTVKVSVADSVAPGTYPVVINAAGSGVTTSPATLSVVVGGSVTLGPKPAALPAQAGGAAVTSAIAISRAAPFSGPVALTVSGAPDGMTASINPASTTDTISTISVTADVTVANGTYPLVVRASGTGVADDTALVAVMVIGSGVHIVYAFQGAFGVYFESANGGGSLDTIPVHGAIRWENRRGRHSVVSTSVPSFTNSSGVLTSSGYAVVFDTPGTYTYQCGIHGSRMTGTVVVK